MKLKEIVPMNAKEAKKRSFDSKNRDESVDGSIEFINERISRISAKGKTMTPFGPDFGTGKPLTKSQHMSIYEKLRPSGVFRGG